MTTAHRPTWNTAKGGSEQGGNLLVDPSRAYSALDLPAHLKLKSRQLGQGSKIEQKSRQDFKTELLLREQNLDGQQAIKRQKIDDDQSVDIMPKYCGSSSSDDEEQDPHISNKQSEKSDNEDDSDQIPTNINQNKQELDDEASQSDSQIIQQQQSSEESEDDEDSSSEDEEELMREFEKVKAERAAEKLRIQNEKLFELKKKEDEEIASGNPLLTSQMGTEFDDQKDNVYSLKRKWNEETVFKNQARIAPETKKRFINDTVRSDFHRKFMGKYLQ